MGGVGWPRLDIRLLGNEIAGMDGRDLCIASLERQLAERDARIAELEGQVAALRARVAELQAQLGQNSTNSSKPPSTDPPGTKRGTKRAATGRRPGGQPGHEKRERELLPVEQVDNVISLVPNECSRCGGRRLRRSDVPPARHQVVDIPPIQPKVTEYQCHEVGCVDCGAVTRAAVPAEARSMVGDRLGAIISLLLGRYRLSHRLVQEHLSDLLGVELSLGMMPKVAVEMSKALAEPTQEATQHLRQQDAVNGDETGWYEGQVEGKKRRAWLWLFACRSVAIFRIALSRGSEVVKDVLGANFAGILTTDRWSAYNWYDIPLRQLCWSHLTRDWQAFIDRGGEGERLGKALMKERHRMFKWWHRARDGTMPQEEFARRMYKMERKVGRLLREAAACPDTKVAGTAKEVLKLESAMWTFVQVHGIEPTNNFGERCIRQGALWRKTSFGTQSPWGSRFVERILTTVTSLKLQKRNVLEFLTQALASHRRGQAAPSLLPATADTQVASAA
jgi:transposase